MQPEEFSNNEVVEMTLQGKTEVVETSSTLVSFIESTSFIHSICFWQI